MNQNGISNIYIDHLMDKISYSFRGTFSADNIPKFEDRFFSLIINLSNEGQIGSHFIALFITDNEIIYFDSFGSLRINAVIEDYLKSYRKPILYTQNQIQHLFSSHCGFFCISFIICMENMIPLETFFKMFYKKELYLNDFICVDIITCLINCMYLRKSFEKCIENFLKY